MKSELIYRHIGSLIQSRRKQLGLTQEKLARRLVMSRASLASIETGRQNILVHQLYKLASALQLKPVDLLPALDDLKTEYDVEEIPLPAGLNAQQKEQIARLFLSVTNGGDQLKGNIDEHQAKTRPRKRGAGTS